MFSLIMIFFSSVEKEVAAAFFPLTLPSLSKAKFEIDFLFQCDKTN